MNRRLFLFTSLLAWICLSILPHSIHAQDACDTGYEPIPLSFYPGNTYTISQTDYCTTHVSTCDGGNICTVSVELSSNRAEVQTFVAVGVTGTKHARATLSNRFLLEGDPAAQRVIRANLSGSASWDGELAVGLSAGLIESSASILLRLVDESDSARVVTEESLFSASCEVDTIVPTNCTKFSTGSRNYNLAVDLTLGHFYRIDFINRCKVSYDGVVGNVFCGFSRDELEMKHSEIRVNIDRDYEQELDDLREELEALRGDFDGHSHKYATGKGEGHNNIIVETGQPTIEE